ncbi:4'-phosphopantetheinyl transferase Npt [Marinomonas spartinae]|uniref:Enterobactin synthase component D n=1 Tax=Marinomonas spartinae TaxID=1792290 RepID=A0A1A8TNM2_9GAMM|nr:4'-phosphopantetheinyl transferase superfamily protein [Marinomonas spartinae]SBS34833.1 4'-phosphopantetheinyl transferase Npt [Marinomonas spartinae]
MDFRLPANCCMPICSDWSDICGDEFICKEQYFDLGPICLSSCQFNPSLYCDSLFFELGVRFPPSLEKAVASRRAEFLAGRYLAKQMLQKDGNDDLKDFEVIVGPDRCPVWPNGVLGSITHSQNIAACVMAQLPCADYYLGIDAEKILTLETCQEIESSIVTSDEMMYMKEVGFSDEVALTLIFSAKESVFKALYSFIGQYFGFEEANLVKVDREKQILYFSLSPFLSNKSGIKKILNCQFSIQGEMVMTLVFDKVNS